MYSTSWQETHSLVAKAGYKTGMMAFWFALSESAKHNL
jgi:hypothetical protein